jgi:hypothetical protein
MIWDFNKTSKQFLYIIIMKSKRREDLLSSTSLVDDYINQIETSDLIEKDDFKVLKTTSTYKIYTTSLGEDVFLKMVSSCLIIMVNMKPFFVSILN